MDKTDSTSTMDVKIVILLKYFSNFWKTLVALLINSKIKPILAWSGNCVMERNTTFDITDKNLNISVIALLTQDETILLKSGEIRIQTHS